MDTSARMITPTWQENEIRTLRMQVNDLLRRVAAIAPVITPPGEPPEPIPDYSFSAIITIASDTVTVTPDQTNTLYLYNDGWIAFSFPDAGVTLDITGYTADKKYSIFATGAGESIVLSTVQWTNTTTPGPAAEYRIDGIPLLASDYAYRRVGIFYLPTTGDPIITLPGGDVNWGGTEDGATAGNVAVFADITGKVIIDGGAPAGGTPGGVDTNIQYNNAGAFGGSADLTWDNTTKTVTIGKDGSDFGYVRSTANLAILAADASSTDTNGCVFGVSAGAGDGTGAGGDFSAAGGAGGATGAGGAATLQGGSGGATSGDGGTASLVGGSASTDGNGGVATISGGAGATNGNGGDITATPGAGAGSGVSGKIKLVGDVEMGASAGATWTDDTKTLLIGKDGSDIGYIRGTANLFAYGADAATSSDANGYGVGMLGGNGDGAGDGGSGGFVGGNGGATGKGGGGTVRGGAGGATSGDGGEGSVYGGDATTDGNGGPALVRGGNGAANGNGGNVEIQPGAKAGSGTDGVAQVGTPASNYTQFDLTGHQTMVGDAQPWDDLRVEPVARTTGSNAPTFEKWLDDSGGTSRGVYLYSFDDANAGSEKEVHFTMQMPHGWNGGDIHIHVHWIGAVADTTAEPRWGLEYAWKEIGEVFGDTTIVYAATKYPTDADVTAFKHYLTEFSATSPGSTADGLSSVLIGRLFRDSANAADTYNATGAKCGLLYIDAHYQLNSIGSTDELSK